jgi:hypothetical protein
MLIDYQTLFLTAGYLCITASYAVVTIMTQKEIFPNEFTSHKAEVYTELFYSNLISWFVFNTFCSPFKRVVIMLAISTCAFIASQIIISLAIHESHEHHL